MAEIKDIEIRPQEGFQMSFASSNADVVFGGGNLGGGKSYGLVLAMAEPLMADPDFRAMISRRSLGNQKAGGGFVEKFKQIFGADYVKIRESENPRVTFPNGTFVDLTYLDDTKQRTEQNIHWKILCHTKPQEKPLDQNIPRLVYRS